MVLNLFHKNSKKTAEDRTEKMRQAVPKRELWIGNSLGFQWEVKIELSRRRKEKADSDLFKITSRKTHIMAKASFWSTK